MPKAIWSSRGSDLPSSTSVLSSTIWRMASRVGESVRRTWRMSWRRFEIRRRDLLRRPILDVVVELLHLLVQVVDQVKIVLDHLVDQPVGDHSRPVFGVHDRLDPLDVERRPAFGCLANRDHGLFCKDEVDLLVVDAILVRDGDGAQEDSEDVVALPFEPGPRLVPLARGRHEALERLVVNRLGEAVAETLLGWIEQVYPGGHAANLPLSSAGLTLRAAQRAPRVDAPPWRRGTARRPVLPCSPSRRQ